MCPGRALLAPSICGPDVDGAYGDLPDGEFDISGHASPPQQVAGGKVLSETNIQITQRDAGGRYVISAQHYERAVR